MQDCPLWASGNPQDHAAVQHGASGECRQDYILKTDVLPRLVAINI
ncbi:hypothetical protein [uncultured Cardiobacterium sp.]|nr:hypothetical protein [uncultured Cardiobacterium sp.]